MIDPDSVKAVSDQFSVLTVVIILAGFLVITFVMMLQTKMRANEIAVLLSLGFTKGKIVLQHIIEAMIPAWNIHSRCVFYRKLLPIQRSISYKQYICRQYPNSNDSADYCHKSLSADRINMGIQCPDFVRTSKSNL